MVHEGLSCEIIHASLKHVCVNLPMSQINTITVALTGASGLQYGLRLIHCLLHVKKTVWILHSAAAQVVAQQEMGIHLPSRAAEFERWLYERYGADPGQLRVFGREQWSAPVASGCNPADAMVVCPCSMGSLAAISLGLSDNLIERAADVSIKEGRKLILVPRETPFSAIHLEHMLKLARLGVVILPPSPGFYYQPDSVEAMVDFVVAKILDQLFIEHNLLPRWGESL